MIKIVGIGKLKEKSSLALFEEYTKRISAFSKIEVIEVPDLKIPDKASDKEEQQVIYKEGQNALEKIKDDEYMILLDLHGEEMSSEAFAKKIEKIFVSGKSTITFVIGGSLGVSEELVARANYRFKMSELTFPHQLVRVLLAEQIYRAFTIQKGITYHK